MPTVSNTSPLLNLAIIGRLELVRAQFEDVIVPHAVAEEFRLEEDRPGSSALRRAIEEEWIAVEEPSDDPLIRTLRQDLDLGESEAIALAVEKEAGLILLDEREGRRRARAGAPGATSAQCQAWAVGAGKPRAAVDVEKPQKRQLRQAVTPTASEQNPGCYAPSPPRIRARNGCVAE